ncbi:MAG: SDR family NAD(P)-dependent oxidoreductase [Pseudomonadota bacterium]
MRFEGKRAIVTGGASGIGRATALRLAAEGAEVWIGDIDDAAGEAVAAEAHGLYRRCDVSDPAQIAALIAEADAVGGLDALVNNAGASGARGRIDELSAEDWDRTQALLLRSVAMGIRHAAPLMAARGGGAIVNTSSVSALQAGAAPIAYSVAKAGVLHLTQVAAAELAQHRIRVNAVVPGFIATNIFAAALDVDAAKRAQVNGVIAGMAAKAQPIQRAGAPEDIAAAIAYLLSDDAGFVTGTSITVDGGMMTGARHSWDPATPGLFDLLDQMRAG